MPHGCHRAEFIAQGRKSGQERIIGEKKRKGNHSNRVPWLKETVIGCETEILWLQGERKVHVSAEIREFGVASVRKFP